MHAVCVLIVSEECARCVCFSSADEGRKHEDSPDPVVLLCFAALLNGALACGTRTQVHFDRKGTIAGAEIKTYLLEKARVIHQTAGERNYHIFYQVCAASSQQKVLQDLGVTTADVFNYSKTCKFPPPYPAPAPGGEVCFSVRLQDWRERATRQGFDVNSTQRRLDRARA